jgi:transcriptional regulator with XRE-family HTH domain
MAKNFRELEAKMAPERRARNAAATERMLEEIALAELRETRDLTQEELAARLDIDQAAVSKMEKRSDIHLSTLSNVVRALGGTLKLRAEFPNGDVHSISLTKKRKARAPGK